MVPHQGAASSYRRRPVSRAALGHGLRPDDQVDGAILLAARLKRGSGPSANSVQPDLRRPVPNVLNPTAGLDRCTAANRWREITLVGRRTTAPEASLW